MAPNATLAGDVVLAAGSSVWYGAVVRGDTGAIRIGKNSNIQDNAVLHTGPNLGVTIGKNVSIGHSAVVHGCTVGDGALIGMHATVMNGAVVGKNAVVAARGAGAGKHRGPGRHGGHGCAPPRCVKPPAPPWWKPTEKMPKGMWRKPPPMRRRISKS